MHDWSVHPITVLETATSFYKTLLVPTKHDRGIHIQTHWRKRTQPGPWDLHLNAFNEKRSQPQFGQSKWFWKWEIQATTCDSLRVEADLHKQLLAIFALLCNHIKCLPKILYEQERFTIFTLLCNNILVQLNPARDFQWKLCFWWFYCQVNASVSNFTPFSCSQETNYVKGGVVIFKLLWNMQQNNILTQMNTGSLVSASFVLSSVYLA